MNTSFTFKKTGLLVDFKMISTGNPVTFLWQFGDGETNNTDPELNYEYEDPGFYTVVLTATYENPENPEEPIEETITRTIGVSPVDWQPLDTPLTQLFQTFIPPGLEVDESSAENIKRKWQLFLQPLVNPEIDVFDELFWPPLVNYMIAQLIAYDLIIAAANRYLIGIGLQSGTDTTGSAGEVKSVRTGPSEVEWFQGSETWSEVFKQGGTFEELTKQICTLAHRLRITLYICEHLSHSPIVPRVHKKPQTKRINIFKRGRL